MIFKTLDQLKEVVPTLPTFALTRIKPHCNDVEFDFIRPLIGASLFDPLKDKIEAGTELTEKEEALTAHIRNAVGNLAWQMAIPEHQVNLSSDGIHISTNDNKKTAFEWQIYQLQKSFFLKGYRALDRLLEFLEEKSTDYEWKSTNAYKATREVFITSAAEFTYFVGKVKGSRYLYLQLLPTIRLVEHDRIKPILGDAYEPLKAKIKAADPEFTASETAQLILIRYAVAHLALADAMDEFTFELTDNGGLILNSITSQTGQYKTPALPTDMTKLQNTYRTRGESKLAELEKLVNPSDSSTRPRWDNDPDAGIMLVK